MGKTSTEMSGGTKSSFLGHLTELRQRLIKGVIAVIVTTIISFVFFKPIFYYLILPAGNIDLIYIEMTEMIGTIMKVCFTSGIILAMPYLIYQLLMFVSPALTRKEKKYIYFILPFVTLMFLGGITFAYFILIPPASRFLITFGSDIATPQIKIGNYISIVTRLLLAIGLVFEMPVITTFLAKIGVITSKWLASKRKIAFISAFILGALITPTFDPINQSLVAAPLIILYEMSIWLAKLVQRKEPEAVTSTPPPAS
jgi:sec-independent protein translocase protein TatC